MPIGKLKIPIEEKCPDCEKIFLKVNSRQPCCSTCQKQRRRSQKHKGYIRWRDTLRRKGKWIDHLADIKKERRKYDEKQKRKIIELLGNKCRICGRRNEYGNRKQRLAAHEIYGKKHKQRRKYIIEHYKDFVILCYQCHKGVHFCMKYLGLMWKEIKSRVELHGN